jgi:hypothetical protein
MPRTTLLKTTLNLPYPALPIVALSADINLQAASGSSGANGNQFAWGDAARLLVIAQNSGASGRTVTITSKADPFNRTGDISAYALAAGLVAGWIIERTGFLQTDGMLYLEANHAEVKFAAIPI